MNANEHPYVRELVSFLPRDVSVMDDEALHGVAYDAVLHQHAAGRIDRAVVERVAMLVALYLSIRQVGGVNSVPPVIGEQLLGDSQAFTRRVRDELARVARMLQSVQAFIDALETSAADLHRRLGIMDATANGGGDER